MKKLIVAVLVAGSLVLGTVAPALATRRGWAQRVRVESWGVEHGTDKDCEYGDDGYLGYCEYNTIKRWTLRLKNKTGNRLDVECRFIALNGNGRETGQRDWIDFGEVGAYGSKLRRTRWFRNDARSLRYWCDVERA
jgi:hypothetical protein